MAMNFNFEHSAFLSEQVIREMITKCVEEQTNQKVADITFKSDSVSYDCRETTATVKFKQKDLSWER